MKIKKPLFSAAVAVFACLCLASSMAFAQAPTRKGFGKGSPFTAEELPPGKLKSQLQTLPPQARDKAMKWLYTFDFSEFDAAEHLRVDDGGGIFIVCPDNHRNCEGHSHGPAAPEATTASPAATTEPPVAYAAVPVSSPPAYSSKPGATRHIYLDFNGGIVSGTAWSSTTYNVKVWSQDADRTTFNDAEQTWMRRIYERVAEDYAPFDVNVTTDTAYDPDNYTGNKDFVGWLMICETTDNNGVALPHNGYGGVAYVGVFGNSTYSPNYQPAWVSSTNGGGNEAIVAEAASHEMGHNMGLSHDGTSTRAYYGGHAGTTSAPSWGPIMGTGYNQNVSQWSKGEYFDANQLQDDLSIMSGRIPYRTDDHGDNFAGATAVVATNNAISQKGIVETTNDPDVFSFTTGAGAISFTANPYRCDADTWGGNLDVILELYDSSQTLITSSNPAALTTASISTTVAAAGTYYLVLKPSAAGTPLVSPPSGYTVYGSLGQFTISGTVQPYDPPLGLTGISPSSGNAGSTVTVDISGAKLASNTAVKLEKAGRADIAGTAVQMIGSTLRCQFNLTGAASGAWDLTATNPDLATSTLSAAFTVNGTLTAFWSEDFDSSSNPPANWDSQATTGSLTWSLLSDSSKSHSGSNLYSAPVPTSKATSHLISATISIPGDSTNAQLRFWHSYNLESQKDGGRLQLSLNNGASWFNIEDANSGASFSSNGYNATMSATGNPATRSEFDGMQAWTGNSNGYVQTLINLTDAAKYAGASLRVRWSIATNSSTASSHWYVDTVSLLSDSTPANQSPVITVAASTSSSETEIAGPTTYQIIRGASTSLSVTATDDAGESDLTYSWQSTGPTPVVFQVNGNNAAKNTTATFSTIGDYLFTLTAMDTGDLSTTSTVNVRVLPTDSMVITPSSGSLTVGNTLQFSAAARDQFGTLLPSQPSPINWSTSGGGSIDSTGLFTATTPGGPFTITATSGASYSATAQVTVNPAAATVTLGNLNQTYNSSPRSVSVTTTPSGLAHSVTYAGSSTAPTNVGTYAVVATITDPNYTGSASGSLVIAKASQTINFAALDPVPDTAAPFTLGAIATSGLTVSYASSNPLVATLSGSTVNIVGLGTATITASQAGNTNFNAAASVPQTLTVVRANPLAVTGGPYKVFYNQPLSLNGGGSQPSYGATIISYSWDLNNDGTFGDAATGPSASISFADLTTTWGMAEGLNPIKLKVTDSAGKTSATVSTTVEIVIGLTWDASTSTGAVQDGSGVWIGGNWWDGSANQSWTSGSSANFGNGGTGAAVTLASPTTVNNLVFNSFSGTYTLGTAANSITLNGGITKAAASGTVSIISPIALGADQTWTNNSSNPLTASSTVDNGGHTVTVGGTGTTTMSGVISGAGGFMKNGSGRFSFGSSSNANTYSGPTTINGGILSIANNSASLSSGNLTLNGGVLGFYWGAGLTRTLGPDSNQVRIPGGESGFGGDGTTGPTINLGTTLVWGASGEGSATGHFNPGKFVLGSADIANAGVTTFSSAIDLNGTTRTIVVPKGLSAGGNVSTISGVISSTGTAGLIKEGNGSLVLTTANTYTGGTTISGGNLRIGNNTAGTLNSGNYSGNISIASGGNLQIWSTAAQTLGGTISGAGGLQKAYGGTLTLSGPNTYTGRTSFLPQTTAGFTVNITSFNSVNGGTPLMASSSLGAPATIANGTIDIGDGGKSAGVNLNYTGPGETTDRILNFGFNGGDSQTLTSSGSGLLKFTSAMTSNTAAQTGKLILAGTGSGEITQALPALPSGGLTKNDGGSWTLGGANSYTGPTAITAGKLFINGNQSSATGNVSVAANATLGGTGTLGGNTTLAAGGKLEFNLSTPVASHDPLDLASGDTLTFSGASELTITSSGGAEPGIYTLITGDNNIGGAAPATLNLPAGWAATVSISGNSLLLNVTSTGSVTAGSLAVTAAGGLSSSGYVGGSFSPGSVVYTLSNPGQTSINWTVAKSADWVTLNASSGTLAAGASTDVTVAIGGTATSLGAGNFGDTVTFTNTTNGTGNTTRPVALTVNALPTYTVSYDGNTHTGGIAPSNQTKTQDVGLVLSGAGTLARTGYTFTGWNTAAIGNGISYGAGATYTANASATLFAQWMANTYTVTFDANGGSAPSPTGKSVTYDSTYGALATVSRTGYAFNGWFTAASGGTQMTSATIVSATADHTLYAHWIQNGALAVTSGDLASSGTSGGAFSPPSKEYTLQNTGSESIGWTVAKTASWVDLGATSGTLAAGASTTVTVSINAAALAPGAYNDTVTFANTTNGTGNTTRGVALTVISAYQDWANDFPPADLSDPAGNNDGDTLTNLQEFAFGMDPTSPVLAPLSYLPNGTTSPGTPILEIAGATYRAVFARRKDYQTAGLSYTVSVSADLASWTTVGTPPVRLSGDNADPVETVSIDFPASVPLQAGGAAAPKFFRVALSGN